MTQRFFIVAIAMAALCAATDASPAPVPDYSLSYSFGDEPSWDGDSTWIHSWDDDAGVAAAGKTGKGLRGTASDRKLVREHQEVKFCDSIGCPDSFTPVPEAWTVPCDGECDKAECCEAYCSYHSCPGGYIPIENAGEILCTDQMCTTEQCCSGGSPSSKTKPAPSPTPKQMEKPMPSPVPDYALSYSFDDEPSWDGEQTWFGDEVKYCDSIGCPESFTPVPDAWGVMCEGECDKAQCCEVYCSYYSCPDGYIPIENAGETFCTDQMCTTDQCCDQH